MESAPERIGRYELVTEIARGPLGRFNAAFVTSGPEEGRIVTLHEIAIPTSDHANHERVRRAGVHASSIRHPDLVAVLDVLSRPTGVAVVSEYVDAASLKALLRRTSIARAPLAPAVALTLILSVVRALRAGVTAWKSAVSRGEDATIVHGGLLPDSVFIATFGETMLADLGVAGAASRTLTLSRDANAVAYRAPEQLEGKPIDERADVYSVGVLLWEMLANRPLFGPPDRFVLDRVGLARDVAKDVCARRAPRLDSIPRPGKKLSPILVEMVQQLLAGDRDARFPSLDALLEALGKVAVELASPEQVAVVVDHMLRSELEARRAKLESVVGFDRTSLPPQSARSTARPPPPTAGLAIVEPADRDSADFSPVEATTARRKSSERRVPPPIPTRTKPPVTSEPPPRASRPPRSIISTPPPPLGIVAPLPPVIVEPPLVDPVEPALAPVEPVMLGISQAPSTRSRQLGLLIGIAIAVTVGIVAIALIRGRSASPDVVTRPAEPVLSVPLVAKPSKPDVTSPEATTSDPPLPPAISAPPRENEPRTPTPTGGKKPYRPRGI